MSLLCYCCELLAQYMATPPKEETDDKVPPLYAADNPPAYSNTPADTTPLLLQAL